jgi:hypothetical protein
MGTEGPASDALCGLGNALSSNLRSSSSSPVESDGGSLLVGEVAVTLLGASAG